MAAESFRGEASLQSRGTGTLDNRNFITETKNEIAIF